MSSAQVQFDIKIAEGTVVFTNGALVDAIDGARSGVFLSYLSDCVHPRERNRARTLLCESIESDTFDFRARTDFEHDYRWFRLSLIRRGDVLHGEIIALSDEQCESLGKGVLSLARFEQLMDSRLSNMTQSYVCFMIDVEGLEAHSEGKSDVSERPCRALLDCCTSDALGSLLPDGLIVISCAIDDEWNAEKGKTELSACIDVFNPKLSAFIASACSPADGISAADLLACAEKACRNYKKRLQREPKKNRKAKTKSRAAEPFSDWRKLVMVFTAAFCVVMLLFSLVEVYVRGLEDMINSDSSDYLREISRQIDASVTQAVGSEFNSLRLFSDVISSEKEARSLEQLDAEINSLEKSLSSEGFALVTTEGELFFDGEVTFPPAGLSQYIDLCRYRGQNVQSGRISVSDEDYIVCLSPTKLFSVDGVSFCAAASLLRAETLNSMLMLTAFDGAGSAFVVSLDGTVIVRGQRSGAFGETENLLWTLKGVEFSEDYTFEHIERSFAAGGEGVCRYSVDSESYIAYYSLLSDKSWMLFAFVPQSVLGGRSDTFLRITAYACIALAMAFTILLVIVIIVQRRSRASLEKAAYVDDVTGGASRVRFLYDVKRLLDARGLNYSIIYTNVERFKLINDRFGKNTADLLLRFLSGVFASGLAPNEACGRINADHFAILIASQDTETVNSRIAAWREQISEYEHARANRYSVSSTFGVYKIDDKTLDADILIDRANLAVKMLDDSLRASGSIAYYDNRVREKMRFEQSLSDRMEAALIGGEFKMYLQPQYETETRRLYGFEALVRWESAEGMLYPNDFIPLFENNGFVARLDLYMFEEACRFLVRLKENNLPLVVISVNVSRVQLLSDDLMGDYLRIWERYDIPASCLEFEFTESVIYDNLNALCAIIDEIHKYGFSCAMDDFGAGYSSLNMLHVTNVDVVKLDRSFLGCTPVLSEKSAKIVSTLIHLAGLLGMEVVAEGVEYEPQVDFLRECGCKYIQGFYFARPMPADDAFALLKWSQLEQPM